MSDESSIAPWSHPKAQDWFKAVFERSGALLGLADELSRQGREFEIPEIRLYLSLLIILGREGIWPAARRVDLVSMTEQLSDLLRQKVKSPQQPMTIEAHRQRTQQVAEAEYELELLRRGVGLSRRVNRLDPPSSWRGFWNA